MVLRLASTYKKNTHPGHFVYFGQSKYKDNICSRFVLASTGDVAPSRLKPNILYARLLCLAAKQS